MSFSYMLVRSINEWFDVNAGFNRTSSAQLANNIQTLSTAFSGVRADGINNLDLSIHKNVTIRERFKVQFGMTASNSLNHVQFGPPNTTPTSTAFGTVTAELGDGQRTVYFGLKLMF